jgi:putative transposase
MKRNKFSEAQIIKVLKKAEAGRSVSDLCREHSIHESTFYNWKKKYGGMQVQEMQRAVNSGKLPAQKSTLKFPTIHSLSSN